MQSDPKMDFSKMAVIMYRDSYDLGRDTLYPLDRWSYKVKGQEGREEVLP